MCCLAGSGTLIEDIRASDIMAAVHRRDTAALYDQLVEALSYQGTSDEVALAYIQQHGSPRWSDLADQLAGRASCPRLRSYWDFHGCRYDKTSRTCAEPEHHADCPLPRHRLRNGRLNQMAYSLFLFLRDVAGGDLIGWIDSRLALISQEAWSELAIRQALIEPLRHVFGASDKVLAMTISDLLLAGSVGRPTWLAAGVRLVAIDTLVHNFLHRSGILRRFAADHAYGPACYRPSGCADIIGLVAEKLDARQFNRDYPAIFPRFIEHAIWRYCAQDGLAICNGNRINDRQACANVYCQNYSICDKIELYSGK